MTCDQTAKPPSPTCDPPKNGQMQLGDFAAIALEKLPDGFFLIARDARILYVNQAACSQLGYSKQELLKMTILDINPGLTEKLWNSVWGITEGNSFQVLETEHRTKDGKLIPVEVLAHHLEINGVQYSYTFTRDLATRKELEARLRNTEKMEAIGQLAGGIAHDFNNQLSGILGYAGLLKIGLKNNPELLQLACGIIAAGQRSAALTTQLLAFSRQGKYLAMPLDLHLQIDETLQMLLRSFNKNIKITTSLNATNSIVTGDPTQLGNTFLNLAINARDAMPEGGELRFSTCNLVLDETACAQTLFAIKPGNYIVVKVKDTGVGISPEVLPHIFEPFYTTKPRGKGTGMGLASVYGTVKNHKGAIKANSQPGLGSEFVLYFPVSTITSMPNKISESSLVPNNLSARVLLIDDEEFIRNTLCKMLEMLGCKVSAVGSGADALSLYRASPGDFDIVILDLIMPQMGGKETFMQLRAINPQVVTIIASGYSLEGDVQELLQLGAKGFVQKPFDFDTLAQMISNALNFPG